MIAATYIPRHLGVIVSLLVLAASLIYASILPLIYFIWQVCLEPRRAWSIIASVENIRAAIKSVSLLFVLTPLEIVLAIFIAFGISRSEKTRSLGALLALPLFMGASYCALIWRLLLDPISGPATIWIPIGDNDWTASPIAALAVIAFVQCWVWTLAIASVLHALGNDTTRRAEALFGLDGARPLWAYLVSIWATRRSWLALLTLATVIENLRSFEPIYVLTRGGPGTATETLPWAIFERSYVTSDTAGAAALALVLIVICIVALSLLYKIL